MRVPYRMRPEHVGTGEVTFANGLLSTFIEVTSENRCEEEIGYQPEKEEQVKAALSHEHGTSTFNLNARGKEVDKVLELADADFELELKLKEKYNDFEWRGYRAHHMSWEGQKSLLVGRCDGKIVGIASLDLRFISDDETSTTRYFSVGVGPFYVPANVRGRAHGIEMSIAVGHLCSVLLEALYHQIPDYGGLGVSVYTDYLGDADSPEVHPFVQQIFDKLKVVREMLAGGYLMASDNKHLTISFLPVTLER